MSYQFCKFLPWIHQQLSSFLSFIQPDFLQFSNKNLYSTLITPILNVSLLTQFSLLKILSDVYLLLLIRMFTIQSHPQFSLFQSFCLRESRPLLNLWCLWKMHWTSSSERWTLVLVLLRSSESAGAGGDPSSIPGLERSPGDGIGYPLQYSWASLVAQMVKKPPVMWETRVQSLGWKTPWRRAWQPTPVFLPGESQRILGGLQSMGSQRVGHDWATKHSTHISSCEVICKSFNLPELQFLHL